MALDHYVSQVHLRKFYDPELGQRMHAIQKRTLKYFVCNSQSQCRIKDHSSTPYLQHPRAIEDFLKTIEPNYNDAVSAVARGEIGLNDIFVIAGFVAFVVSCAPAGIRLSTVPIKELSELEFRRSDALGELPPVPDELGGGSISDWLDSGKVRLEIDEKYPLAVAIAFILDTASQFGNSYWDVIENEHSNSPFFTSDFPVAIEEKGATDPVNRIVPLTPHLAVRIVVERGLLSQDFSYPNFRFRRYKASISEVRHINRLIVQCAEETVYFSRALPWIQPFVKKHADFHVYTATKSYKVPQGTLEHSRLRVGKRVS